MEGSRAVDNVDLIVEKGELSSIIGPNGAGKTTLFNVVTKRFAPDNGKVIFKDKDITSFPPEKICYIGIIRSFQRNNLFPMLTTFENIQSAILMYHRKQMDLFSRSSTLFREETLEVLSGIELTQMAEKIASTLPYGDQRKLEIGIALSFSPELLLLDEPTAGMSRHERFAMAELIQRLAHDRGLSIVFIEHDMDVVLSISEKVRVMHQGRIIAQGNPEEIKKNDEVKRVYLGEGKK